MSEEGILKSPMLDRDQPASVPAYALVAGELKEIGTLHNHGPNGYSINKEVREALDREFPNGYSYKGEIAGLKFTSVVFSAA